MIPNIVSRHISAKSLLVDPNVCRPTLDCSYQNPLLDRRIGKCLILPTRFFQAWMVSLLDGEPYFLTLIFQVSCILCVATTETSMIIIDCSFSTTSGSCVTSHMWRIWLNVSCLPQAPWQVVSFTECLLHLALLALVFSTPPCSWMPLRCSHGNTLASFFSQ